MPAPRTLQSADRALFPRGPVRVGAGSRIIVRDPALREVAGSLEEALWRLADLDVGIATTTTRLQARDGDLVLALDGDLGREEYRLESTGAVEIVGGSVPAVSWAVATLLQISRFQVGASFVPRVRVEDGPAHGYRGLVVDVASRPYAMEQLRELVEFARFYKVSHLQLRLSSDEAFSLPTSSVDTGRPWRTYLRSDLEQLEAFAISRGVTVVPEIGLPSTARALVAADPARFSLQGANANPGTVHLAREAVYEAVDTIIGDLVQIFPRAPLIHIGGLEVRLDGFAADPETEAFMEARGLATLADLQRYFTARVARMVSRRGRRPVIWDSPPPGAVPLPVDLAMMVSGLGSARVNELLGEARTVINASPLPLDISAERRGTRGDLEGWSPRRWAHWDPQRPSYEPFELGEGDVAGAAMSVSSLEGFLVVPALRHRLPRMAEALWSGRVSPGLDRRVFVADSVLMRGLRPAQVVATGRTDPDYDGPILNRGDRFAEGVILKSEAYLPGDRVLMTVDGTPTDGIRAPGRRPGRLSATTPVRFQVLDQAGRVRGFPWLRFFERRPLELAVVGALAEGPEATPADASRFDDSVTIIVRNEAGDGQIRFTTDGTEPDTSSAPYSGPLAVSESAWFRARLFTKAGTPLGDEESVSLMRVDRVANLGRGRPVLTRSSPTVAAAAHAFDGLVDPTRSWAPPAHADSAWIQVDLGREVGVGGVSLHSARTWMPPRYRVRGNRGDGWTLLVDRSENEELSGDEGLRDEFDPLALRTVRVELIRSP
ncbi:MAG: family 20 glycosylhydrolase, partial [Gemmatimonadota bacterium]|nr:family 20 glycosylhydrolase [Gemmatimonadota bacterium]